MNLLDYQLKKAIELDDYRDSRQAGHRDTRQAGHSDSRGRKDSRNQDEQYFEHFTDAEDALIGRTGYSWWNERKKKEEEQRKREADEMDEQDLTN